MRKILTLLILLAMLFSLVSCESQDRPEIEQPLSEDGGNDSEDTDAQPDVPELEPPSDEVIEEMKKSWYELYGKTLKWIPEENIYDGIGYYYGTYNGYVIMFCNGVLDWEVTVKIGKESFWNGCDFEIYAYKNGSFDSLEQVYENGYLGDEDIAKIAAYHNHRLQEKV